MKKRIVVLSMLLSLLIISSEAFGGLFFKKKKEDKAHLTFMVNFQASETITGVLEEVVNEFNAENPDIEIELIPGTSGYEAMMKAKMAANDLPDMWSTHGWSVARYSEYLTPLQDQSWVTALHPSIRPVITNKNGEIFVLPIDVDVAGVAYNKDVVKKAGVNVENIKTWNDLFNAMEKVKNIGVTPVHIGGKDNWTIGNFFDWAAPSFYVTDDAHYKGEDLKNGKFDTEIWTQLAEMFKEMHEAGYLNVDVLTSTFSDSSRALATGEAAFEFYGNYVLADAWSYNPDANLGFFPVPAFYEGDEPSLISGERTTVGIWKDTKYPEQAKRFLQYLAKPEVMGRLASANGIPAGLTTATSDTGKLAADYKKWEKVYAFPYFDREFLPSGMWDTMCSTGAGVLSKDMTPKQAAEKMLEDYKKLYK
ncbi:MAG: raffinose/stachyose/melibiose transport system substrate-binding protein [Fusobacteriaceae bacterium]|jgi:raffinose/stachyose/melibiose transport system substrate-binding protein|nr:extracellular solute-binding protein family 1 [Fusobacteriales bacterium]MDN5305197.1 raffinose/stachyose/melibiose transport system substrate-binding protein [Fusobacteriaceae bacterium]